MHYGKDVSFAVPFATGNDVWSCCCQLQHVDITAIGSRIAGAGFVNDVGFCPPGFFGQLMKLPLK